MNLDFALKARIECQMKLAGDDLHHRDFARVTNLLRGEVERALVGCGAGEIELRLHLVGLELADDALRPPNPNLGLWNRDSN